MCVIMVQAVALLELVDAVVAAVVSDAGAALA